MSKWRLIDSNAMTQSQTSQVKTHIPDPASVDSAILSRFSARAYIDKPVDRALLEGLLDVARRAASGGT